MATVAEGQSEAAAIIRSMVETVTVRPTVRGRAPGYGWRAILPGSRTLVARRWPLWPGEGGAG